MSKPRCASCAAAAQPPSPAPMMAMLLIGGTAISSDAIFRDLRLVHLNAEARSIRYVEKPVFEAERPFDQIIEIFVPSHFGHDHFGGRGDRNRAGEQDLG